MNITKRFIKRISCSIGLLVLLTPLTGLAQTKVVVIPLYGDDPKPLKNIITVAKANGDFKDPVAAVNSITDASAENPYLVVIGPGVYTIAQTLQMKQYVDITGSGENVTKITGTISTGGEDASSAIISGVSNSALSSLTVENNGGGGFSIALYNDDASPSVSNVTATASGGTNNYGIYNSFSSSTLANVAATASGGTNNYGIYNSFSSSTLANVAATGSEGTNNYGVYNLGSSSPTMINVTATASGESNNYGVYNSSSSPTMTGVTAKASGGNHTYGVYNDSSSPTMTNVNATASGGSYNYGVRNDSSSPTMTNATVTASGGNHTCGVYNGSSSPTMTGVIVTASGGSGNNEGVRNEDCTSPVVIRRSTLKGKPSLYTHNGTTRVSQSTLVTGANGDETFTHQCVACDDGNGNELGANCLPPPPP